MDFEDQAAIGDEVLAGLEVAFLVAPEGAEESETLRSWEAVAQAGGHAVLISPAAGHAQLFDGLDRGTKLPVDRTLAESSPDDFDALVLPGGVANGDFLRMEGKAVDLARAMFAAGKPVAAVCHAPWLLVEADLVSGRSLTSWPSLRTDIRNAGGDWRDEPVVVCERGPNVLITSRRPDDLPIFCDSLVQRFAEVALG